jgi:hypothetical protein
MCKANDCNALNHPTNHLGIMSNIKPRAMSNEKKPTLGMVYYWVYHIATYISYQVFGSIFNLWDNLCETQKLKIPVVTSVSISMISMFRYH